MEPKSQGSTSNVEIDTFLSRHQLSLVHFDNYIEMESDSVGWSRQEVEFRSIGSYEPPEYMTRLIEKYDAQPPIRGYYSFCDVESRSKDEEHKLIIYAQDGDWRHIYALNELSKNILLDPENSEYRAQCEKDFMPGEYTRLYRQMCCHVLVVSADRKIVLCRRRQNTRSGFRVPFYPGAWAASLEENMLRDDPGGKTPPDADLFACVERGVYEELQIRVRPENLHLLSYGIEWNNFGAAFLFLARADSDYEAIAVNWRRASDRVEAIAIDSLSADMESITHALLKPDWQPSSSAKTWKGGDSISKDLWHGTSRARLRSYLRYLHYAELDE